MLDQGVLLQGRYRILHQIGGGGMGAVYRAWDTRLNVPVALKEMMSQPGLDPQAGVVRPAGGRTCLSPLLPQRRHLVGDLLRPSLPPGA